MKLTAIVASNSLKSSNTNFYNLYFKGVKLELLKNVSNYGIIDNDLIIIGSKMPQQDSSPNNLTEVETVSSAAGEPTSASSNLDSVATVNGNLDGSATKSNITDFPKLQQQQQEDQQPLQQQAKATRPKSVADGTVTHTITKKKKSSKSSKKCNFANCNNASLRMIGSCQDCGGNFCSKHRLMENHCCAGLNNFKKIAFNRNASKLQLEQTISQKV